MKYGHETLVETERQGKIEVKKLPHCQFIHYEFYMVWPVMETGRPH
jgi:hypothetical protein